MIQSFSGVCFSSTSKMGRSAASTVRPRAAIAGFNAGVDIIAGVRRGIPKENVEPHYDMNQILDKHPDGIAMLDNTVEQNASWQTQGCSHGALAKQELANTRMSTCATPLMAMMLQADVVASRTSTMQMSTQK
jgi:hypothetical protein